MLYAAIDIRKRTFHAAVLDVETGETAERRFAATREELNNWTMPLQGKLAAVAIEATCGWRWVWREVTGEGDAARVVAAAGGDPDAARSDAAAKGACGGPHPLGAATARAADP
jgi:hypothetical protein